MNQIDNIKLKISKHLTSNSILDILISIKCYLTNNEENPFYIFQNDEKDLIMLEIKQSLNYNQQKEIYDSILQIISIKPIELILIPKNRKISLINFVDDLIDEYSEDKIIIIDSARTNPFTDDVLFVYLKNHNFNEEIINVYNKRKQSKENIIKFANLDNNHFKTSLEKSRELKILDYWKNIWGLGVSYKMDSDIVDNLIL